MNNGNPPTNILKNNFHLSDEQIAKIENHVAEVMSKNRFINLISRKEEKNIYERHVCDSLEFINLLNVLKINPTGLKIIDIGSGGGFPGIVLAIALPETDFTLAESSQKKYSFLLWLKENLKLTNVEVINKRIDRRENIEELFDFAIERASGKIADILPVAMKIIKPEGFFVAWQNIENITEIKETKQPHFIYNYSKQTHKPKRALFVFGGEKCIL